MFPASSELLMKVMEHLDESTGLKVENEKLSRDEVAARLQPLFGRLSQGTDRPNTLSRLKSSYRNRLWLLVNQLSLWQKHLIMTNPLPPLEITSSTKNHRYLPRAKTFSNCSRPYLEVSWQIFHPLGERTFRGIFKQVKIYIFLPIIWTVVRFLRRHLDKAPRLSISIVICILSSDTLFVSSTNSIQIVRRQCCLIGGEKSVMWKNFRFL